MIDLKSVYCNSSSLYPNIFVRILISLIVSHLVLTFGASESTWQLLHYSYYYIGLGSNFIIVLAISEFIYVVTVALDENSPWAKSVRHRIILQILIGIVCSVVLITLLVSIYFYARGKNIVEAGYFKHDFTIGVCFVVIVNAYYVIVYLVNYKLKSSNRRLPNVEGINDHQGLVMADVVLLYALDKNCIAVLADGSKIIWDKNLKESLILLGGTNFYQINRSTIVKRSIIEGYVAGDSRTLILKLIVAFKDYEFVVSQRNAVDFKRWYVGG